MACAAAAPGRHKAIVMVATCPLSSPETAVPGLHQLRQQKKQKLHHLYHRHQQEEEDDGGEDLEPEEQPLLPGLPDHLAQLCLARLPPRLLFCVCRSWRRLLYSHSFPPFLSLYALLSPDSSPSSVELQAFDPLAGSWRPLPHHPQLHYLLLRHPGFLSRPLPVQSVAAAGRLVLLAATTHALLPALPRPLVFQPATCQWSLGPRLRAPRRWCAAGAAGGRVYVGSGVGGAYSADVARSMERWDPSSAGSGDRPVAGAGAWERLTPLRDGRFSRDAVEAVPSGGKLCMVNVKGRAAKDGAVYDVAGDRWETMPPRLLAGWTGPAAAADGGSTIYVADEEEGELRAYDWRRDAWEVVVRSELLRGAAQMAAGGGRVCVACAGGEEVVVVDVAACPARVWTVAPPEGCRVVALHVLPRMSHPEHHL